MQLMLNYASVVTAINYIKMHVNLSIISTFIRPSICSHVIGLT